MDKKRLSLRLSKPADVRKTLARIANMVINKEVDNKTANTIIIACNAILSAIRIDEQQRKLDELERFIQEYVENDK